MAIEREIVPRPGYQEAVMRYFDQDLIKFLVGQRRVGKSYLLLKLMQLARDLDPRATIVYVNKELHDFADIQSGPELIAYLQTKHTPGSRTRVYIDEIQEINGFEHALRHLQATGEYDVYCTGSNARLFSKELASNLAGRYMEFRIFSLSWQEFLLFHKLENNLDALFLYMRYGGLPYLRHLRLEDGIVFEYLRNIYQAILFKDVVSRHNIRNPRFLEDLVYYLADTTGSILSAKSISDYLKNQRIGLSPSVVLNYLSYLEQAFFVFKTSRIDVRGKKVFEIGEKYYFEDPGLRHTLVGYRQQDSNKILENLVYNHLLQAGYEVYVGSMGDKEVDFVAIRQGKRLYVQTAYLIPNEKVREREFGNLALIRDNYPKLVVSMDPGASGDWQGIKHRHVLDFLNNPLPD